MVNAKTMETAIATETAIAMRTKCPGCAYVGDRDISS
jgi:hypothetical protein